MPPYRGLKPRSRVYALKSAVTGYDDDPRPTLDDAPEPASDASLLPEQPKPGVLFKPGESGNPGTPAPKPKITPAIRRFLDREPPITAWKPQTIAEELAQKIIERAINGSDRAAEMILDRTEGKVPERIEVDDGGRAAWLELYARYLQSPETVDAEVRELPAGEAE